MTWSFKWLGGEIGRATTRSSGLSIYFGTGDERGKATINFSRSLIICSTGVGDFKDDLFVFINILVLSVRSLRSTNII